MDFAGDYNADCIPDLLLGAPGVTVQPGDLSNGGRAYVVSGTDGSNLLTVSGDIARGHVGSSVAWLGDRNTHPNRTFVIGASTTPNGKVRTGKAYVFEQNHLLGDLNGDGCVDTADWGIFLPAFGNPCPAWPMGCPTDLNCDGVTDAADLSLFLSVWGHGCS